MAKELVKKIKLQIPAGKATPAPPVGTVLGPVGINLAEFCSKYYRKGQQVLVEGRIQNRTWEDQSGQKRYATDYIIENAYFADSRRDADMSNAGMANNASTPASTDDGEFITIDDTEELPF